MSNEEIFEKLKSRYQKENIKMFCLMTSDMYNILSKEFKEKNPELPNEDEYNKEWWNDKYLEYYEEN